MATRRGLGLNVNLRRQKTVEKQIRGNIVEKINRGLSNMQRTLTRELRSLIDEKIRHSPEYESLTTAILRGEFGLEDPRGKLDGIIKVFLQAFGTRIKLASSRGKTFKANLSIFIDIDFDALVELDDAYQEATHSDPAREHEDVSFLPWLRWLLIEGTGPFVYDHSVVRGQGTGRSGLQFLMEYTPGQNYFTEVPQFTGTESDNFLTRAISDNSEEIRDFIRKRSSELMRRSFKV